MFEKIAEIISSFFDLDPDEITEDTNIFDDLAASDYDMARLLQRIEEELNLAESPDASDLERLADASELTAWCAAQTDEGDS